MLARLAGLAVIALAVVAASPLRAEYPERPITIIVPWAAGGSADASGRMLARLLEQELDVPVSVVNRTGDFGMTGHSAIAGAATDGYTLGVLTVEIAMTHWQGLTELTYADYTPLALYNADAAGLLVGAASDWQSAREMLDAVEAEPGAYHASGGGEGSIWHLALAGMLQEAGLAADAASWVPSQSVAAAWPVLVTGGLDLVSGPLQEARTLLEAGQVRSIAVMSRERDPAFPGVPTLAEATGIDWTAGTWHGIAGPQGLPQEVSDRLVPLLRQITESQEFRDFMARRGLGVVWRDSEGFREWMAESDANLGSVLAPGPAASPVEVVAAPPVASLLGRVADRFGAGAGRLAPVVREGGVEDAIDAFCAGARDVHPDLLGVARRLRQPELDACAAAGVDPVTEIKLGYEALVLATSRAEPARDVDLGELWLAFTAQAPDEEGLGAGPLERWPEVGPEQPEGELPVRVGMPGQRQLEALSELGLSRGCLAFPAAEASPLRDSVCTSPRRLTTVDMAESELPVALETGVIELALMTFAGFNAGRAALKPIRINGIGPAAASIRDGGYALAQPLYLYVKRERVGVHAGLAAYLATLTAEAALARSGDLGALGLVPLPRGERQAARQAARTLPALALERPNLLPVAPLEAHNQVWSWASAAEMALRAAGLPPLPDAATYRCGVVTVGFGSCQPDCASCLNAVATTGSLVRALDSYQQEVLAQGLIGAPTFVAEATARLKPGALRRMIRNQRRPVVAQVTPQGGSAFYPPGMTSHFALIVGSAGTGHQARLTVNDPYPYPEALNPYLAAGERTGEPGQYRISYGDFRRSLGYRQSVLLR